MRACNIILSIISKLLQRAYSSEFIVCHRFWSAPFHINLIHASSRCALLILILFTIKAFSPLTVRYIHKRLIPLNSRLFSLFTNQLPEASLLRNVSSKFHYNPFPFMNCLGMALIPCAKLFELPCFLAPAHVNDWSFASLPPSSVAHVSIGGKRSTKIAASRFQTRNGNIALITFILQLALYQIFSVG